MLSIGVDYKPEPYSAYKNRVVAKHIDKVKNQLQQIRQCSLKGEDKQTLIKKLIETLSK